VKHNAEITLPVELIFEVWPPLEVRGEMLPPMVEVTAVLLEITGPAGKPRKVDITKGISEDQLLLWEDEIIDTYGPDSEE
jgi:hypothetical protein